MSNTAPVNAMEYATPAVNGAQVVQPPATAEKYDKPNIFVCGPSGSGKSTSLRNLDPARTIILNTEQKQLPFRKATKFTKKMNVTSLDQFNHAFDKALSADADVIVIDSFTSLIEYVYTDIVRSVEKVGDNVMAAWAKYKDTIHDILIKAKTSGKYVVFIGIDDTLQDEKMRITRTIAVQGSLKGKIEKEFEVVLWTKVVESDALEGGSHRYVFVTNSDGSNKAKTPMEMFDEQYIDNDLNYVISTITDYYTGE